MRPPPKSTPASKQTIKNLIYPRGDRLCKMKLLPPPLLGFLPGECDFKKMFPPAGRVTISVKVMTSMLRNALVIEVLACPDGGKNNTASFSSLGVANTTDSPVG